jgi:hypothetical protein
MVDMEDRVLGTMKDEGRPMKAGEVADLLGAERKEVDKAFTALKRTGAITSPKRCFWEPSE